MRNMLKADLYRLAKSVGFWVTLAIIIGIIVFNAGMTLRFDDSAVAMGVNIESIADPDAYEEVVLEDGATTIVRHLPEEKLTGKTTPFKMATVTDNLIWFILPFVFFAAAVDFSCHTVKNLLGSSRTKYYCSKLILSGILCVGLLLLHIIASTAVVTLVRGFGGGVDLQYFIALAKIYLPQLFILFAYVCLGVFLAFTFKRVAVLNTVYIAFGILPSMVFVILGNINPKYQVLLKYDLSTCMSLFAYPDSPLAEGGLFRALISGGILIIGCTVGGLALFRRCEIK